jgi:hypothetical protein
MISGLGSAAELNVDFVGRLGGGITEVTAVSGNYAYVGQGQDFLVIDISNAANPTKVATLTTDGTVEDIVISGNYAYVADGDNGFVVIDITTPSSQPSSQAGLILEECGVLLFQTIVHT